MALATAEDARFLEVNEAFAAYFGYRPEEMAGRSVAELALHRDPNAATWIQRTLRETGRIIDRAVSLRARDGSPREALLSIETLRVSGEALRLTVLTDITARRQTERALQESETRLKRAQVIAHVGDWQIDLRAKTIWGSEEALRIYGLDESLPTQPLASIQAMVLPEYRAKMDQALRELIAGTGVYDVEFAIRRRSDDGVRFLHSRAERVLDENGAAVQVIGVVQDITRRRQAEDALRESEERITTTLYSISDGVISTDTGGRLAHMNRAAELMTGWIESRARGRPVGEVFRLSLDETGTPFEDPTARAIRERRPVSMSGVLVGPDAMRRLVSCRAAPIRDARGNVSGAVLVFADETKERELEAQVVQAQKLEAVGRLAGGIAHDYNNTLAVILGYVQLMEQDLQAEDHLLPGVRAIADAARRSAALTRQLLIFARRQVIAPVPLDLNASIASLEKILQRLVGEDITLRLRPAAGLWSVKIDPTQVDQILTNLCTNARDAIRDTGTITIETSNVTIGEAGDAAEASPGRYVCVTFRDTGEGMDRATRERIFEPFFTTKPAGRGTGLGMATVFGIVKQNNGFIAVSSELGRGTTVRILLPRLPGDARVPAEPAARTPSRGTGTVLLVEDEPQLLQIVRAMLEAHGYSVIPAATPRTALELSAAYDREIDLLLTDVVMPEMNGRELQKRLLALRPGMKALFMSGYATEVVAHRGIAEEGVPFIPKPFTPQGLMAKVEEVLGASVPE